MMTNGINHSNIQFHDSLLLSVEITGQDKICLSLRTESGDPYRINLDGVRHFKCDGFREGNTVFEIEQVSSDDIKNEEMEALLHLSKGKRTEEFTRLLIEVSDGTLMFLRISASYGANVISISQNITISGP